MTLSQIIFFVCLLGFAALCPSAAQAAFLVCNQTKAVIEAAFGHRDDGDWTSVGWWQLQPGQCSRVYSNPLTQRFYFYYAHSLSLSREDGEGPMVWSGKYGFCIGAKAFRIQGDSRCEERGYKLKGFQEVDVGVHQKSYTLTFQDYDTHQGG